MIDGVTRRGTSPIFVGRRAELDRLDEAFQQSVVGMPSVCLIAGDAGVGKSRLVAEFLAGVEATGAWTTVGGCLDLGEGGLPYAPFVEALRGLIRRIDRATSGAVLEPSADVLAALLPDLRRPGATVPPIGVSDDPAGRLARLFDAVLDLLGRLSTDQPLVLVLEDLHWADGSTRDLLRFLVRNMRSERLLVVATYRTDDVHRRHPLMPLLAELERADNVERLELKPFERAELVDQLAGILGETPDEALVDVLLTRSDGLPFYVEELVAGTEWAGGELPSTLRDILGRRLATLTPGSLSLVGAAAVVGGRFSHERLIAASGMDEGALLGWLREAIDAQILVTAEGPDGPTYAFRHALLREAAYDELLPAERVHIHTRLADHLESRLRTFRVADPAVIADFALHADRALDQARALEGSVRATQAFVEASAYREALVHAERALELWPRVSDASGHAGLDHPDLLILTAGIASALNRPERALGLSRDALLELTAPADRDRRARLLATLYLVAWEVLDFETAGTAIEEAYALVRSSPPSRLKAFVLQWLAWHRSWQDHERDALQLLEEAMSVALAFDDRAAWTDLVASSAGVLAEIGEVESGVALLDQADVFVTDSDCRLERVHADLERSMTLMLAGRFEQSRQVASDGLTRAKRYGWEARLGPGLRDCLGEAFHELGRYDEAIEAAKPVVTGAAIHHHTIWAARVMTRAYVAQGRLELAHRISDGATPDQSRWSTGAWDVLPIVELARADGRYAEAISRIEAVIDEHLGREHVTPLQLLLGVGIGSCADMAVLARRRRRARDVAVAASRAGSWMTLLRSVVEPGRHRGGVGPFIEATVATAEAEVSRLDGASDPAAWAGTVDRWVALAHPYQTAYARLRLAEAVLGLDGDRAAATSALRAAHESASAIGALPLRIEIEGLAARARIDLGTTDPGSLARIANGPALTTRERGVLRLVSEGHTNREIGDRLFISEKTVSVHVSNAMAKLGALSRYEAAASADRLGLL